MKATPAIAACDREKDPDKLRIVLEDLRQPDWKALFVGDRQRYATASAVRFLDPETVVVTTLLPRKIYLIRFDLRSGSYTVLDRADTMFGGTTAQTDLCDIDGFGSVVTSNCHAGSMSLYRCESGKIKFTRDLPTQINDFCHGARFCGPDIVVATLHRKRPGAHFFNLRTMEELLYVPSTRKAKAKDICFLSENRAILLTTDGAPTPQSQDPYLSRTQLVEFDLKRKSYRTIGEASYEHGQFDSGVIHGNKLYAVDGYRGCILVIDTETLNQEDQICGYEFPHGIDIKYGMMALTSYGTNSIDIQRI